MKIKNSKNKLEKSVGIFEMSLMILSIITFSYLIGEEIGLVSGFGVEEIGGAEYGGVFVASDPSSVGIVASYYTPGGSAAILTNVGPEAGLASSASNAYSAAASGNAAAAQAALDSSSLADPFAGSIQASGDALGAGVPADTVTKAATFGQNTWTFLKGTFGNALVAVALYGTTKWIAGIFGASEELAEGLSLGASIGYFAGATFSTFLTTFAGFAQTGVLTNLLGTPFLGFITITPLGLIGLGVGLLIGLFSVEEQRVYQITYTCLGWQPVSGGENCEECNKPLFGTDEIRCSEYRCKSLGQGCKLVNDEGSGYEMCTWVDRNDVPPEISSWDVPLDKNLFKYIPDTATLPGDRGVKIQYIGPNTDAEGCMPPFTILEYGVALDKSGKCRVDTNRTTNYDSMFKQISGGYSLYNHTMRSIHGGATELESEGLLNLSSLELSNGKDWEVFVRCKNENGFANDGSFVFKYCVQDEPDITAPIISGTTPLNGFPIQQGLTQIDIEVYTNKPSDCKWSHTDDEYESMPNLMSCAQSITEMNANMLYKCTTTLTGLRDSVENKFYFNCESYPLKEGTDRESERRHLTENEVYILVGTKALVLDSVKPKTGDIIRDSTETVPVTLEAKTSAGYDTGKSSCSFKATGSTGDYIFFANTDSYQHSQELWLTAGDYSYDIRCCDLGGNCDTEISDFSVETDFEAPMVVRLYNEGNSLKLITNEKSECVYDTTSCNYEFANGIRISSSDNIEHSADWDTENTLFIKCKDEFDGQPSADQCTIIARPSDSF